MNNNSPQSFAWTRALTTLAAIAIAALLSSCAHLNPPEPTPETEPTVAEKKPPPEPIKPPPPSKLYEWWGKDYVSNIEVSINEQKARFYSGDQMVGWTTVASGIHKFPTPTGRFAVTEKVQNKKSNLYGKIYNRNGKLVKRGAKMGVHPVPAGGSFKGAPMPYFMRLTNDGIGMHAGPIPRPGKRASHGCIRMPKQFAPVLYRYVDIGTSVTIKGNGPTYAKYLAKQRKSSPKPKAKATAVAKAGPATTPATEAASPVGTPATEQTNTAQAAADVTPTGSQTTVTQQPATSGMNGVTGNAPTQPNAVPPSKPAADTAAVRTRMPSYSTADAASAPTADTAPAPAADAAPSLPPPATLAPPAPAMTDAPPSRATSPEPAATTSTGPTPSAAPAPTAEAAPVVPTAPPAPSSAAPTSMTGVPAMPTPPASQTAPPVAPTQPPTASGPTAPTEG